MNKKRKINIGLVGTGAWGWNLLRNYAEMPDFNLVACCDMKKSNLKKIHTSYPDVKTTSSFNDILKMEEIDAISVATTASNHYRIAKAALLAGKDIYVEKPFTLTSDDAKELRDLSRKKKKILMVGHLLLYHPVVRELKRVIQSGEIGDIYYIYGQRLNLGKIRKDENALWSFAPHDVSVILYLLDSVPVKVCATGSCYLQKGVQDVVFMTLFFKDGKIAHIHMSWLDPHKIRRMTVVGSKKMAVFDDMQPTEKLRIYDKGAIRPGEILPYSDAITIREGDIHIPMVKMKEPLRLECEHFAECVRERKKPLSDAQNGLDVVKILEAAQKSLDNAGKPEKV